MHTERFFITTKVRGVIFHEEKILLSKAASRDGRGGFYCLPGGTLEKGEGRKEGLHREIIEELGVEPTIGNLIHTQEFVRPDGTTTFDFWYEITNSEDFLDIDISTCSHGFEHEHVGFYDENSRFDSIVKPDHLWELVREWKDGSGKFIQ